MQPYVYLHAPTVLFKARVNMTGVITYPITDLTFDTVTVGAYTDILQDMTLMLGSSEGADDLGRVRVQNAATSTTIPVGRISQGTNDGELDVADNAYITVWADDWRVWAKIPYIDPADGTQYKDSTIPVGTYTEDIPPVANCGPSAAGTIDSGTSLLTVSFDGGTSFAVADGATIDTFAWDVGAGTITVGTSADAAITATFPAGAHIVSLTVTDSNGVPHTARCMVYAHDPDNPATLTNYSITRHSITKAGQELDLKIEQDLSMATYPDGFRLLFWDGEPSAPASRDNMLFDGWHHNDEVGVQGNSTGNRRDTTLHFLDVAGKAATLPGFDQEIERSASPTAWTQMVNPTFDKYIHYLLLWHSTVLSLADYFPSDTGNAYPFVILSSAGETFFEQIENKAKDIIPAHHLQCNRNGQLGVYADPQLQDSAYRTTTIQGSFTEAYTEQIQFSYTRPPRVGSLRGYALLTATDYTDVDGVPTLLTVQCIAPGLEAPGQGVQQVVTPEGLCLTQAALNSAKGHEYARLNSRYGLVVVTKADDAGYRDIDPGLPGWVDLTISAATAAQRGLTFSETRTQCKQIDYTYTASATGIVRRSRYQLEIETVGHPAITVIPPDTPFEVTDPAPTPPSLGLITGDDLVAGLSAAGMLYATTDFTTTSGSGGPTWTETDLSITDTTLYSWVVDPFSPGYILQDGTGAVNAWAVGDTNLWRITDIFGTPSAAIAHTFAVALGTSSVPEQEWRTVQASFGAFFLPGQNPWLMVVSHYRDASGHVGTWSLTSVDGGASFGDEVQITPHYAVSTSSAARPIALYLSPKTPGKGLTAAYSATVSPSAAQGYSTSDWGATWTEYALLDTGARLGDDIHVPWLAAGDDTIYHGHMEPEAVDDPSEPWVHFAIYNATSGLVLDEFVGRTATKTVSVSSPGSGINVTSDAFKIIFAPAAEVKRIKFDCSFTQTYTTDNGTFTAQTRTFTQREIVGQPAEVTDVAIPAMPSGGGTVSDSFTTEWTRAAAATDWSGTRAALEGGLPALANWASFYRWDLACSVQGLGVHHPINQVSLSVTVNEIELETGEIYTPAGDTRAFSLRRVNPDTSVDDLSPLSGGVHFGPNAPHFRIRAHDNDADYLLAALTGNDVSGDTADDTQAVFVSTNAGASWTQIVAPVTGTQPFAAAFGATNTDELYIWGPSSYFGFSDDFGATIDDRSGNLSTFTPAALIGICGGPIS